MPASQMVVVDPEAVAGDFEGELEVDLQAVVRKVEEAVVVRIVELQVEKSLVEGSEVETASDQRDCHEPSPSMVDVVVMKMIAPSPSASCAQPSPSPLIAFSMPASQMLVVDLVVMKMIVPSPSASCAEPAPSPLIAFSMPASQMVVVDLVVMKMIVPSPSASRVPEMAHQLPPPSHTHIHRQMLQCDRHDALATHEISVSSRGASELSTHPSESSTSASESSMSEICDASETSSLH